MILNGSLKARWKSILTVDFEMKKGFSLTQPTYKLNFKCGTSVYSRMLGGISGVQSSKEDVLISQLLQPDDKSSLETHVVVDVKETPNLPLLSDIQKKIVSKALSQKFTIIQGPPGSGKTMTLASIAYNLHILEKSQILVCAPSNTAADNIARKIEQTGMSVIRVYAYTKEFNCALPHLALHKKIYKKDKELGLFFSLLYKDVLTHQEVDYIFERRRKLAGGIIKDCHVVVTTLCTSGSDTFAYCKFPCVLIDEATQCVEPECLIPIKNCKKLILVGDHKQLGPVITCPKLMNTDLKISLFERVVATGMDVLMLDTQFRMHPSISKFPSINFYDCLLKDGIGAKDRQVNRDIFWISKNNPTMFINHDSIMTSCNPSYFNRGETKLVIMAIQNLNKANVENCNIGIVTPYRSHKDFIIERLDSLKIDGIEVDSVDGFQGREKDYIILSCVRSSRCNSIGFLRDERRLNVAITRAKYGLIIIGNAKALIIDPLWNNLLDYYCVRKLVAIYSYKRRKLHLDVDFIELMN